MKKQNGLTKREFVEHLEDAINTTTKAVQLDKFRAIEGDDFMSDETKDRPVSYDTLKMLASYKAPPKTIFEALGLE
jgi:hypothetical protein